MPVCKAEAHRALKLLEDYYWRLDDSEEKELKAAIERVIKIFKSRLFQALLDIQEFYELTLMDDGKSNTIKVNEAKEMVSRWEVGQGPFAGPIRPPPEPNSLVNSGGMGVPGGGGQPVPGGVRVLPTLKQQDAYPPGGSYQVKTLDMALNSQPSDNTWEYDEIILERGGSGLGFSIGKHTIFAYVVKITNHSLEYGGSIKGEGSVSGYLGNFQNPFTTQFVLSYLSWWN